MLLVAQGMRPPLIGWISLQLNIINILTECSVKNG